MKSGNRIILTQQPLWNFCRIQATGLGAGESVLRERKAIFAVSIHFKSEDKRVLNNKLYDTLFCYNFDYFYKESIQDLLEKRQQQKIRGAQTDLRFRELL